MDRHRAAEVLLQLRRQLAGVDEQLDPLVVVENGEAQSQRRPRHVAAPDVEQPGHRFGHGQHQGDAAGLPQQRRDLGALHGGRTPGVGQRLDGRRGQRRRRPVGPHGVERVALQRLQGNGGALQLGAQLFHPGGGVQPRVVADPPARRQRLDQPGRQRLFGLVAEVVVGAVGLGPDLERVAAIGKEGGAVGEHGGEPGRAGEAGEPRQPLGPRRQIFALMLVGARHDEASHAAPRQLGPQRRQPFVVKLRHRALSFPHAKSKCAAG